MQDYSLEDSKYLRLYKPKSGHVSPKINNRYENSGILEKKKQILINTYMNNSSLKLKEEKIKLNI